MEVNQVEIEKNLKCYPPFYLNTACKENATLMGLVDLEKMFLTVSVARFVKLSGVFFQSSFNLQALIGFDRLS